MPEIVFLTQAINFIMKILACSAAQHFVHNFSQVDSADILYTEVTSFQDGEKLVRLPQWNVLSGEEVLVVQSISGSVNDALLELLFTLDIVHNAVPASIDLLITYLGYSRQDRLENLTEAFSAKVVARILSLSYIQRLLVVDLHSPQALGFFSIPSINLNSDEFLLKKIAANHSRDNLLLVSPDTGNVKSIINMANSLQVDYSIAIKYRPRANENKILTMVGQDITDKTCVIIDDIIDSAGTLCHVAEKLAQKGANSIVAYVTHPVLSEGALDNINNSHISKIFVGDTISTKNKISRKLEVFSIADWCLEKVIFHSHHRLL
jgi:ribose-phosphate pyrophosphokinase